MNNTLEYFRNKNDLILSDEIFIEDFLDRFEIQESVRVFDFDGTLIHKWFNSFAPIDYAWADSKGELAFMKRYMICIENSTSYDDLHEALLEESVSLPLETQNLCKELTFEQLKDHQMNHWRDYTMQKWVERKIPMSTFDLTDLAWRPWAKELVQKLLDNKVQVLIISSWIWNLIRHAVSESWFDLDHPFLHIKSNDFIVDENWLAVWYDKDLITPFTKKHVDYHKYGIEEKKYAIQVWDSLGDAYMISDHFPRENILNVWFTNAKAIKEKLFPKEFDVVLTSKQSSLEILDTLLLKS